MELTAACVALETIDEGHTVTVFSDSSYLVNCMRRGWYKKWRKNGWLNYRNEPVANRDLWERLLEATQRHQEVLWRKVRGHSKKRRPTQERERPCRRARRDRQEGGKETLNTIATIMKWLLQNHPEATVVLISLAVADQRGAIHVLLTPLGT
jgi:hypothetical protein